MLFYIGVMVTFSFKEFGENLGTRQLGRHAREKLPPMIEQNDCVAKLLLVMSLSELKSRTTFRGLIP